jgi:curved DNA-binding protein CbpA
MLTRKLPIRTLNALQRHQYATIANDHWPSHSSFQRHPTPYQILNISPSETYTKSRFIELVKLYHPDYKHHTVSVIGSTDAAHQYSHLPESVRLERYRLIVAAHSLLSDPIKRAAYDSHGIGWLDGLEDSLIIKAAATGGKAGKSAHGNATWEDWERWRFQQEEERERAEGRERPRPEPYYMRNGQFASLLIVFSIGAGAAQTVHAENLTEAKRLVREERHWLATQEYKKSQELARKLGREQRIEEFVRQRDPAVLTQPTLKDLVMNPDICESGTPEGRSKDLDMKRMFSKK